MKAPTKKADGATRTRGRPRRLELEQVIDAALEVGLSRLTMTSVAQRLGVGKAVLYGYVSSREELLKIAASRASSQHPFPSDDGGHWAVWVLRYCSALFEVLSKSDDMLELWISGQQSNVIEVDATELWLKILTRAGFSPLHALNIRRGASQLVIGTAASAKRSMALDGAGKSRSQTFPKMIAGRSKVTSPLLHEMKEELSRGDQHLGWEQQLLWYLAGASASLVEAGRKSLEASDGTGDFSALFACLPSQF
jgi:AcrR family transcriptional regulator